jgi:nitric oxide synthase oxygenase domain/subunit
MMMREIEKRDQNEEEKRTNWYWRIPPVGPQAGAPHRSSASGQSIRPLVLP